MWKFSKNDNKSSILYEGKKTSLEYQIKEVEIVKQGEDNRILCELKKENQEIYREGHATQSFTKALSFSCLGGEKMTI